MSKMTRLPTIEAIHVLAFVACVSFALVFVFAEVRLSPPFLCFITLPFNFFRPEPEDPIFLEIILKIDMSCNIIKSLDVVIVGKVYVQVLPSTRKRVNHSLDLLLVS